MDQPEQKVGPDERDGSTPASGSADEDLLEALRRERADFLNYKRRAERERTEDRERARTEVIQRLLPLLDELDRALAQMPEGLMDDPWAKGVVMSRNTLRRFLDDLGVERLGSVGEQFNPEIHEAVQFEKRPDVTENQVAEVVQPGYRLDGRLIRPARVVVVGPESESKAQGEESKHHRGHRRAA